MQKPTVKCALLAAMVARHRWGAPIDRDSLLAIAAIEPNDYPKARAVFEDLRGAAYVTTRGKRGIELDTGEFGTLADVLYHECEWDRFAIESRLKRYEGWQNHDWA